MHNVILLSHVNEGSIMPKESSGLEVLQAEASKRQKFLSEAQARLMDWPFSRGEYTSVTNQDLNRYASYLYDLPEERELFIKRFQDNTPPNSIKLTSQEAYYGLPKYKHFTPFLKIEMPELIAKRLMNLSNESTISDIRQPRTTPPKDIAKWDALKPGTVDITYRLDVLQHRYQIEAARVQHVAELESRRLYFADNVGRLETLDTLQIQLKSLTEKMDTGKSALAKHPVAADPVLKRPVLTGLIEDGSNAFKILEKMEILVQELSHPPTFGNLSSQEQDQYETQQKQSFKFNLTEIGEAKKSQLAANKSLPELKANNEKDLKVQAVFESYLQRKNSKDGSISKFYEINDPLEIFEDFDPRRLIKHHPRHERIEAIIEQLRNHTYQYRWEPTEENANFLKQFINDGLSEIHQSPLGLKQFSNVLEVFVRKLHWAAPEHFPKTMEYAISEKPKAREDIAANSEPPPVKNSPHPEKQILQTIREEAEKEALKSVDKERELDEKVLAEPKTPPTQAIGRAEHQRRMVATRIISDFFGDPIKKGGSFYKYFEARA